MEGDTILEFPTGKEIELNDMQSTGFTGDENDKETTNGCATRANHKSTHRFSAPISSNYFTRSKSKAWELPRGGVSEINEPSVDRGHEDSSLQAEFQVMSQSVTRSMMSMEKSMAKMAEELMQGLRGINNSTSDRYQHRGNQQSCEVIADSDTDSEIDVGDGNDHTNSRRGARYIHTRLPAFTGKETWKVWYNRFDEVARRGRWNDSQRLDELLPRLQGAAGDYVFSQLPASTRSNYRKLIQELNSRFQVIELPKAYRIKLSNRSQRSTETPEEYAADLKSLYDKAFPNRSIEVRQEDLLRYFLDGLQDDQARQQIEFVKEPTSIDEAVKEVVIYQESKRRAELDKGRRHKTINMVRPSDKDEMDEEDSTEDRLSRVPIRDRQRQGTSNQNSTVHQSNLSTAEILAKMQVDVSKMQQEMATATQIIEVQTELKGLTTRVAALEQKGDLTSQRTQGRPRSNPKQQTSISQNRASPQNSCFRCGDPGHFVRNCPQPPWITGHMQLAVQGNPNNSGAGNSTDSTTGAHVMYSVSPNRQVDTQVTGSGSQQAVKLN